MLGESSDKSLVHFRLTDASMARQKVAVQSLVTQKQDSSKSLLKIKCFSDISLKLSPEVYDITASSSTVLQDT